MTYVGTLLINYRYRRSKPRVAMVPIMLCNLNQVKSWVWRDEWKGFFLHVLHNAERPWLEYIKPGFNTKVGELILSRLFQLRTINPRWREEFNESLVERVFNAMLKHVPLSRFNPERVEIVSWSV